jgi:hypothetical protein
LGVLSGTGEERRDEQEQGKQNPFHNLNSVVKESRSPHSHCGGHWF